MGILNMSLNGGLVVVFTIFLRNSYQEVSLQLGTLSLNIEDGLFIPEAGVALACTFGRPTGWKLEEAFQRCQRFHIDDVASAMDIAEAEEEECPKGRKGKSCRRRKNEEKRCPPLK